MQVYLVLGVVAIGLLWWFRDYWMKWLPSRQGFVHLSADAGNDLYYQSKVDFQNSVAPGIKAEPGAENQPLEHGVDIYQGPTPDEIPGQYDSSPVENFTYPLSNLRSSKHRSNLTDNGDMIERRRADYQPVAHRLHSDASNGYPYDSAQVY